MSIHSEGAQARIDEIRAMRQKIPNFVIPTSKEERRKLAPSGAVPPEFVERVGAVVKNSPALTRGGAPDPEHSRDLIGYAEAYESVAGELEALAQFIRHSITVARNTAGSDALISYALAQRLAKRPEHGELIPHIAEMRRLLGPRGRKPRPRREPAPTSPDPAPPTTPQ